MKVMPGEDIRQQQQQSSSLMAAGCFRHASHVFHWQRFSLLSTGKQSPGQLTTASYQTRTELPTELFINGKLGFAHARGRGFCIDLGTRYTGSKCIDSYVGSVPYDVTLTWLPCLQFRFGIFHVNSPQLQCNNTHQWLLRTLPAF